jgi:hypothetical protein
MAGGLTGRVVVRYTTSRRVEAMASTLGWRENPRQRELDEVKAAFPSSRWLGEREVVGQGHGAPLDKARAVSADHVHFEGQ